MLISNFCLLHNILTRIDRVIPHPALEAFPVQATFAFALLAHFLDRLRTRTALPFRGASARIKSLEILYEVFATEEGVNGKLILLREQDHCPGYLHLDSFGHTIS